MRLPVRTIEKTPRRRARLELKLAAEPPIRILTMPPEEFYYNLYDPGPNPAGVDALKDEANSAGDRPYSAEGAGSQGTGTIDAIISGTLHELRQFIERIKPRLTTHGEPALHLSGA